MSISEIVSFAVVGILVGVLATAAVPERTPGGKAVGIIAAVIGAMLGSKLGASIFGDPSFAFLGSIVLGVVGALAVVAMPRRRRSTRYHL